MSHYGVAVTRVYKGRVTGTELVRSPDNGAQHLVCSGDMDYARKLCESMRRAESKYGVPFQAIAYSVVPLPVAPVIERRGFTEAQARALAATDRGYSARQIRGQWLVWCNDSDHAVEF